MADDPSMMQMMKQARGLQKRMGKVQKKVEKLMIKWNEAVLGVPRMVTMGYGLTVFPPVSEAERRAAVPERRVRAIILVGTRTTVSPAVTRSAPEL